MHSKISPTEKYKKLKRTRTQFDGRREQLIKLAKYKKICDTGFDKWL